MRFRVVTYNIHRAIGVDRRFRPQRILEILLHHAADVVLLQEVDEGAPRSREIDLARALANSLDYPHVAIGHNVTLRKGGRYGNATLSRLPIVRERNIDLTIGARKGRGCQHTTLLAGPGGQALEVFNLHLGLSAWERAQQVELLVRSSEFADMALDGPCLVGGDFNDWRSRLRPIFTDALGFHCATDLRTGARPPIATYPAFSPRGGLDRVYYRGGLRLAAAHRCRLDLSRLASDHLPVVVDFELALAGAVPAERTAALPGA
ncbi:MAG TPA: endonuclease/exonuclease/phosphatase family protein [Thermoanaerobaculia bacterium]|nr:endonuclease/exonuclease/phosphatase family protein [Thermoanaerobaculia bacterium]